MPLKRLLSLFTPAPAKPRCEFQVPDDRVALLVRNGVPLGLHPPGRHPLPAGNVEVRLLPVLSQEDLGYPSLALGLPFERSLLYLDGDLVAILKPSPLECSGWSAWAGSDRGAGTSRKARAMQRAPSRFRRLLGKHCQLFPLLHLPARPR
jgi:hypothetical protein